MYAVKWLRFYFSLFIAILLILLAIIGPSLAPEDPNRIDLRRTLQTPNKRNPLGTDRLGRDMLSRVLFAARNSLTLTCIMVLIASITGTIIGMTAGYLGKVAEIIIMQVTDVLLAFPAVVLAIAIVSIWGSSVYHTLFSLAVTNWAKYARVSRRLVVNIRNKEYLTFARFGGARKGRLLCRYILPNILPQVVVVTTQDIGEMMIMLSSLSFLGLIGEPPNPEWGSMLAESRNFISTKPYLFVCPALVILLTVIIFNLLGDSIRDIIDPKEMN